MLDKGLFPPPTKVLLEDIGCYRFRIFIKSRWQHFLERFGHTPQFRGNGIAVLNFLDVSGEWYEYNRFKELNLQYPETGQAIRDYLAVCAGILFLYDPSETIPPSEVEDDEDMAGQRKGAATLVDLLHMIAELPSQPDSPFIEPALAICITKVDDVGRWEHRSEPEILAREVIPRNVRRRIEDVCRPGNYKYFTVSSIGVVYDYDGLQVPNYTRNQNEETKEQSPFKLRAKDAVPIGVIEPLQWLLERARAR